MQPDILIIGGGPAALTAAVYSLRAGKSVLILEREHFGGQIADSPRLENFPSIKSISGLEFADNLFEQATSLGASFELDEATSVEKKGNLFAVKGASSTYEAASVIIASGVKHRKLGIPGEEKLLGHGISYCAVCDGAFYQGKEVMVIGDANSALQYAILLAGYCPKVTVATLFDRFYGEEALIKMLLSLKNVEIHHNLNALSFNGEKELSSVAFEDTKTKEKHEFEVAAAFVAIGQIPENDRFAPLVELKKGYILTDEDMATKTPGLFAAGDCRDKKIRQVATAINDGAIAALSAQRYLLTLTQS
jgi:thioredoxin reductase (NADPH)